ncbi:MAG: hypothetical protein HQ495_07675 [Alphaproteobacteria bacterium]|nr:hypothetical protein [Alphaproteobacteria bacterium]
MTGRMDAQAAHLTDYLIDMCGGFAVHHAGDLAVAAHRRGDYEGEAFWWVVSMRIAESGARVALAA